MPIRSRNGWSHPMGHNRVQQRLPKLCSVLEYPGKWEKHNINEINHMSYQIPNSDMKNINTASNWQRYKSKTPAIRRHNVKNYFYKISFSYRINKYGKIIYHFIDLYVANLRLSIMYVLYSTWRWHGKVKLVLKNAISLKQ